MQFFRIAFITLVLSVPAICQEELCANAIQALGTSGGLSSAECLALQHPSTPTRPLAVTPDQLEKQNADSMSALGAARQQIPKAIPPFTPKPLDTTSPLIQQNDQTSTVTENESNTYQPQISQPSVELGRALGNAIGRMIARRISDSRVKNFCSTHPGYEWALNGEHGICPIDPMTARAALIADSHQYRHPWNFYYIGFEGDTLSFHSNTFNIKEGPLAILNLPDSMKMFHLMALSSVVFTNDDYFCATYDVKTNTINFSEKTPTVTVGDRILKGCEAADHLRTSCQDKAYADTNVIDCMHYLNVDALKASCQEKFYADLNFERCKPYLDPEEVDYLTKSKARLRQINNDPNCKAHPDRLIWAELHPDAKPPWCLADPGWNNDPNGTHH